MEELNTLYSRLLQIGFIVLRQAVNSRNHDWVEAEVDFLHNIPSLLNETNLERHRYFWFTERRAFIAWVSEPGRDEPKSRMLTFYEPILRDMEPVLLGILNPPEKSSLSSGVAVG